MQNDSSHTLYIPHIEDSVLLYGVATDALSETYQSQYYRIRSQWASSPDTTFTTAEPLRGPIALEGLQTLHY